MDWWLFWLTILAKKMLSKMIWQYLQGKSSALSLDHWATRNTLIYLSITYNVYCIWITLIYLSIISNVYCIWLTNWSTWVLYMMYIIYDLHWSNWVLYIAWSLGARWATTSSLRPFGPAWLRPLRPSGAQAVWPTQLCKKKVRVGGILWGLMYIIYD